MNTRRKSRIQGIHLAPQKVRDRLDELLDRGLTYEAICKDLEKSCRYKFSPRGCCAYRQRREKARLAEALSVPAGPANNTITIEIVSPANVNVRIFTREAGK